MWKNSHLSQFYGLTSYRGTTSSISCTTDSGGLSNFVWNCVFELMHVASQLERFACFSGVYKLLLSLVLVCCSADFLVLQLASMLSSALSSPWASKVCHFSSSLQVRWERNQSLRQYPPNLEHYTHILLFCLPPYRETVSWVFTSDTAKLCQLEGKAGKGETKWLFYPFQCGCSWLWAFLGYHNFLFLEVT